MEPINAKLLRQLLRSLEGIERNLRYPVDQHEHTVSANHSSSDNDQRPEPQAPLHVIRERPDAEVAQEQAERKSAERFQRKSLRVQWFLFVATMLAFGAAAIYAEIARRQLNTMNETLKEAHIQNVTQQRALLVVSGNPSTHLDGVGVVYENRGHVAAKVKSVNILYIQEITGKNRITSAEESKNLGYVDVPVGEQYRLDIKLPQIPNFVPKSGREEYVIVETTVTYDDGFGNSEYNFSCFGFRPDDLTPFSGPTIS